MRVVPSVNTDTSGSITMPRQTVRCPDCGHEISVPVSYGQQARMTHNPTGPDILFVSSRIKPINKPTQPFRPDIGGQDTDANQGTTPG